MSNSNEINFTNNITIRFKDDLAVGDFSRSKMLITQYFKNGRAVHITLDERQTAYLYKKMKDLSIKPIDQ